MPPKRKAPPPTEAQASGSTLPDGTPAQPVPQEDEPPAKRTRTRMGAINNIKKTVTVEVPKRAPAKRVRRRKTAATTATTTATTTTTKAKGKGKAKAITVSPSPSPAPEEPSTSTSTSSFVPPEVPAPAPKKRGRQKKVIEEGDPYPEKRQAKMKSRPSQEVMTRVHRVMTQRIFMISREREGDELKETFQILGSTGNVYTVTIDLKPRCNCPDAYTGHHCKHILFVFLKVLQVNRDSNLWYQKALLKSELAQIFADAPLAPNSLAHPKIREAYARHTGQLPPQEEVPEEEAGRKKIPGEDDDCPICYDTMYQVAENLLVWCEECGNSIHKECWGQWQRTSNTQGKTLTCVWCRADWATSQSKKAGGGTVSPKKNGYYLNFSDVPGAGVSPVRDTSTYYQGPRTGQRYYGYQDYD